MDRSTKRGAESNSQLATNENPSSPDKCKSQNSKNTNVSTDNNCHQTTSVNSDATTTPSSSTSTRATALIQSDTSSSTSVVDSTTTHDSQEYTVERITYGDGKLLKKGVVFASTSLFGGKSTFWEMDYKSLKLSGINGSVKHFVAKSINKPRGVGRIIIKIQYRALRKKNHHDYTLEYLEDFMKKNTGYAVIIGGPGMRSVSGSTEKFQLRNSCLQVLGGKEFGCLDAAISNAIQCLRNKSEALVATRKLEAMSYCYTNLKQCARPIQQLKMNLQMRNISKDAKEELRSENFKYFENIASGVYLARILQVNLVDHIVCVDANRKMILDSVEKYPLRLCDTALKLYASDKATNPHIVELVKIVDTNNRN